MRHLSRFWGKGATPYDLEALTHVGLIVYRANHVDQALARIDQALRIDPRYHHALRDRARALLAEIRPSNATPKP